jgi:hypothetical protein
MATVTQEAHPNNGRPTGSSPVPTVVVRTSRFADVDPADRILKRQVPAWTISGGIHLVLMVLFLFLAGFNTAAEAPPPENQVLETRVEDAPQQKWNFENTDVGLDPSKETNYNVERIENLSVPGKVQLDGPVGIDGAPDGAPQTVPPPPGFGGGQGGGMKSEVAGVGQMFGQEGGWFGGRNLPGVAFKGRSAATRKQMLAEGGGNAASEAAVAKGLKWLQRQQKSNGRWVLDGTHEYNDDVAATGLALLPFLAAGQTHRPMRGEPESAYAKTVQYGLDFLRSKQKVNGSFGAKALYGEAIATMAVCEAYGMTQDPQLKKPAQAALDFLVKAQHSVGGFRYKPGEAGDTSVTGWCLQALKSGQMAGLSVPRDVFYKVGNFLDKVQTQNGAAYGYASPGAAPAMTAVGLLCRQYLGWGSKNPTLIAGVENLKKNLPVKGRGEIYYYYYASQVVHFFGGDDWDKLWNPKMRDLLVDTQDNSPAPATNGSWAPEANTHTGNMGGRLTATCLSLLTLEVYYRHLPLYRKDNSGMRDLEG